VRHLASQSTGSFAGQRTTDQPVLAGHSACGITHALLVAGYAARPLSCKAWALMCLSLLLLHYALHKHQDATKVPHADRCDKNTRHVRLTELRTSSAQNERSAMAQTNALKTSIDAPPHQSGALQLQRTC
jgi:hypothetical protein